MRIFTTLAISAVLIGSYAHNVIAQAPPDPLAACGDDRISFEVNRGEVKNQTVPPEPGKATLYIVEVVSLSDNGRVNRPTLKHGLDGQWIGATQGFTYLSASISPGEHHICSRWQSRLRALSDQISLYNFNAEAGIRYYLRAQIYSTGKDSFAMDLTPVSADEGRYLVSEAARSLSKPKH